MYFSVLFMSGPNEKATFYKSTSLLLYKNEYSPGVLMLKRVLFFVYEFFLCAGIFM